MQYPVMSEAAQAICRPRWKTCVDWPKVDPCADCPLVMWCSLDVSGIDEARAKMDGINMLAALIAEAEGWTEGD